MTLTDTNPKPPAKTLKQQLAEVVLTPEAEYFLNRAGQSAQGEAMWRHRKIQEARELLQLSQLAPRFTVEGLNLDTEFMAKLRIRMPVPTMPTMSGRLTLEQEAQFVLTYPESAVRNPSPGTSFVRITKPLRVFHPNVLPEPPQVLCLGTTMLAGHPVREIVLSVFGALALQNVMYDVYDSAGLLNREAAMFFQQSPGQIPLTRAPFFAIEPPAVEGAQA